MDTWVTSIHDRANILHSQIALALHAQSTQGIDMSKFIAVYQKKLFELYGDNLPLAQLMDTSEHSKQEQGALI